MAGKNQAALAVCAQTKVIFPFKFTLCFFYTVFVHYLRNFDLNLVNKRRRKVIIRRVWLLRSTAVTMTLCQSNITSTSQLMYLSMTSLTPKVA